MLHSTHIQELDKLASHVGPQFRRKHTSDVDEPQVSSAREGFGSAAVACGVASRAIHVSASAEASDLDRFALISYAARFN